MMSEYRDYVINWESFKTFERKKFTILTHSVCFVGKRA